MINKIKRVLGLEVSPVVKAYIKAVEANPERLKQYDWNEIRGTIYRNASKRDQAWINKREKQIAEDELLVKISVMQLTGDEPEPEKQSSASLTRLRQSQVQQAYNQHQRSLQQAAMYNDPAYMNAWKGLIK